MTKTLSVLMFGASLLAGCGEKASNPTWEIVASRGQDARLLLEKTSGCVWSIAPKRQKVNPGDLAKLPAVQAQELVKGMNEFDETAERYGRFELVPVTGIQATACDQLLKKGRT